MGSTSMLRQRVMFSETRQEKPWSRSRLRDDIPHLSLLLNPVPANQRFDSNSKAYSLALSILIQNLEDRCFEHDLSLLSMDRSYVADFDTHSDRLSYLVPALSSDPFNPVFDVSAAQRQDEHNQEKYESKKSQRILRERL